MTRVVASAPVLVALKAETRRQERGLLIGSKYTGVVEGGGLSRPYTPKYWTGQLNKTGYLGYWGDIRVWPGPKQPENKSTTWGLASRRSHRRYMLTSWRKATNRGKEYAPGGLYARICHTVPPVCPWGEEPDTFIYYYFLKRRCGTSCRRAAG